MSFNYGETDDFIITKKMSSSNHHNNGSSYQYHRIGSDDDHVNDDYFGGARLNNMNSNESSNNDNLHYIHRNFDIYELPLAKLQQHQPASTATTNAVTNETSNGGTTAAGSGGGGGGGGEVNLRSLALKYNCSVWQLKLCNSLHSDQDFFALHAIRIPAPKFSQCAELLQQDGGRLVHCGGGGGGGDLGSLPASFVGGGGGVSATTSTIVEEPFERENAASAAHMMLLGNNSENYLAALDSHIERLKQQQMHIKEKATNGGGGIADEFGEQDFLYGNETDGYDVTAGADAADPDGVMFSAPVTSATSLTDPSGKDYIPLLPVRGGHSSSPAAAVLSASSPSTSSAAAANRQAHANKQDAKIYCGLTWKLVLALCLFVSVFLPVLTLIYWCFVYVPKHQSHHYPPHTKSPPHHSHTLSPAANQNQLRHLSASSVAPPHPPHN